MRKKITINRIIQSTTYLKLIVKEQIMKQLHLFLILTLIAFTACSQKSPKTPEKSNDETLDEIGKYVNIGTFGVYTTDNPYIVQFRGPDGTVFLSTTKLKETSSVEITINTSKNGLTQERYFLMGITPNLLMFANNSYVISLNISVPPDIEVLNNAKNKVINVDGILKTIHANKEVIILKGKSPYKFNSVTID